MINKINVSIYNIKIFEFSQHASAEAVINSDRIMDTSQHSDNTRLNAIKTEQAMYANNTSSK